MRLLLKKLAATTGSEFGLEAGPLSQWLFSTLAEAGLPVICVEMRHMRAVLKAQINKTDRNDARGIAQMMRAELYRPVHVKTLRSQKLRMQHNGLFCPCSGVAGEPKFLPQARPAGSRPCLLAVIAKASALKRLPSSKLRSMRPGTRSS